MFCRWQIFVLSNYLCESCWSQNTAHTRLDLVTLILIFGIFNARVQCAICGWKFNRFKIWSTSGKSQVIMEFPINSAAELNGRLFTILLLIKMGQWYGSIPKTDKRNLMLFEEHPPKDSWLNFQKVQLLLVKETLTGFLIFQDLILAIMFTVCSRVFTVYYDWLKLISQKKLACRLTHNIVYVLLKLNFIILWIPIHLFWHLHINPCQESPGQKWK